MGFSSLDTHPVEGGTIRSRTFQHACQGPLGLEDKILIYKAKTMNGGRISMPLIGAVISKPKPHVFQEWLKFRGQRQEVGNRDDQTSQGLFENKERIQNKNKPRKKIARAPPTPFPEHTTANIIPFSRIPGLGLSQSPGDSSLLDNFYLEQSLLSTGKALFGINLHGGQSIEL